jgi:hypothetical protein
MKTWLEAELDAAFVRAYFPAPADFLRANGRGYGYPECCIEAFVADTLAGRRPWVLRGSREDGCVPCPLCAGPLAANLQSLGRNAAA